MAYWGLTRGGSGQGPLGQSPPRPPLTDSLSHCMCRPSLHSLLGVVLWLPQSQNH